MIGIYYTTKCGIEIFIVPYNFSIVNSASETYVEIIPKNLEDHTLFIRENREYFKEGIKKGAVKIIGISNSALKEIRELCEKRESWRARTRAIRLFSIAKRELEHLTMGDDFSEDYFSDI